MFIVRWRMQHCWRRIHRPKENSVPGLWLHQRRRKERARDYSTTPLWERYQSIVWRSPSSKEVLACQLSSCLARETSNNRLGNDVAFEIVKGIMSSIHINWDQMGSREAILLPVSLS
jgi:hypothetical protein